MNSRLFTLFVIIALSLNQRLLAQLSVFHNYNRSDSTLVISETNSPLRYPFAGGLNSCQFANLDINLDGVNDLLVFDRHGNRILPFIVSPANPVKYRYEPEYSKLLPPVSQWVQTIDYNHDGKMDIFTYFNGGIKVYRNVSANTLKFTQVTQPYLLSQQGSILTNILVTNVDYPAIADLDGDGDVDVLSFWGLGYFIEWHRNTSMERFGNADSLTFEKSSACWGHFAEGSESNAILLDTCPATRKSLLEISDDAKHTGSTLLLNDLNGDGLVDLTLGDVDFSSLTHLVNGGTASDAIMVSHSSDFPNAVSPVNMNTFPAAMLADVNNDGANDLLVSPFDPSLIKSDNFRSVTLYANTGTNQHPAYSLQTKSFLQDEMLDFGSGAFPVLMDYNNDGLMDLLVGNYGYTDTCIYLPSPGIDCSFTSQIALLINIGTATKPAFKLAERNVANLAELHMQSLIPSVGDMDGDGDLDLVCGNSKGKLVYCENLALQGQPADFHLIDPAWHSIVAGEFSAPQLFDLDEDGLTDLVCGNRKGTISFYKNTGTSQQADFTLVTEKLGAVDVTDTLLSYYGYSIPYFYKDKQGEMLLLAGTEFGDIFIYNQIRNNLNGEFQLVGAQPGINEGWRSAVAIGNLNNDSLTDLLVGNYSGGMGLFFGKSENTFGIIDHPAKPGISMLVTPNPAQTEALIAITDVLPDKLKRLDIRSADGKLMQTYTQALLPFRLDVSTFRNGIYHLSVQTLKGFATSKLVICR